jgi:hypothetical protein
MCGIVAILGQGKKPDPDAVVRGLEVLHHRGPDATHIWQSLAGKIVLGHKRLSLIDLATGDQPIANETQTVHTIVNGEFYGFERIRADLNGAAIVSGRCPTVKSSYICTKNTDLHAQSICGANTRSYFGMKPTRYSLLAETGLALSPYSTRATTVRSSSRRR